MRVDDGTSLRLRIAGLLLLLVVIRPASSSAGTAIHFERIQSRDGLPQETVTGILQDRTGFLWLGTQDGLVRYDGNRFITYRNDPDDAETLANGYVRTLLEDASGDLWVGTLGGGLSRWHRDRDSFSNYRADGDGPRGIGGDDVLALHQDRDGTLWIGTNESGLDRLDPSTGIFEHFRHDPDNPASLSDDRMLAVLEDRQGVLWIGTRDGLNRFDRQSGSFLRFRCIEHPDNSDDNGIRSIFEDPRGTMWIGTLSGGLYRFDREARSCERFGPSPSEPTDFGDGPVRVITEDRDGRLWIGTDDGLYLVHRSSATVERFGHESETVTSLSNDRVAAIYQDRGGVLWVGTQGGGVNKWDPRTSEFSHRTLESTEASGPVSNDVLALAEDHEGGLWIGTSGGGLHRLDRTTGRSEQFLQRPGEPGSLSGNRIMALLDDRQDRLWIGTMRNGLDRLDPGSRSFVTFKHDPDRADSLGSDGVMTLYEDRQGRLWIGTHDGGLNRYEGGQSFTRFLHDPGDRRSLSNNRVTALAEGADGSLWVGTMGGGLNRFSTLDDSGTFLRLKSDPEHPSGLADDFILTLHVDDRGTLWIGTQAGLHKLESFDPQSGEAVYRRYLVRDGLPSNTIFGIHSVAGKLWLSTYQGLSCLDPSTEIFQNFNTSHGLQSNEFNMGAHYESPDGELFFGGVNGFNSFYPERLGRRTAPPPLVLTSFSKMNEPVTILERPIYDLEEVRLGHDESIFSFEFAALDFSAPRENRYRYKLEGWDQDWIDLGNHPRVTFSNLEPGSYVLRVKAANNDGVWNEEGLTIGVHVTPPWWRTWWFQLFAFLVLSSLVIGAVKARMTQITKERLQILVEKRTQELEEAQEQLFRRKKLAVLGELAGSVAHELRNPLGAIRNTIYLMKLKPPDTVGLNKYCVRIDHEVGRSDRIITELLDWGRDTPADLRRCVLQEIVSTALDETTIPESIRVERRLAPEPIAVEVDSGQIERILRNFLQNAVEAMPGGGDLVVECGLREGEACAAVSDSGIGIAADKIERIFEPLVSGKPKGVGLGLPLSHRYAERNHGRIECESTLGEGSTFRLLLPPAPDLPSSSDLDIKSASLS